MFLMMGHEHKLLRSNPDVVVDNQPDRISELPDPLLCHILSFLRTTKEAAVTSVLSSRWRYLFTSLPDISLEFDFDLWKHVNEFVDDSDEDAHDRLFSDFVSFVNRLILLRDGNPPIRKFELSFGG